MEKVEALEATLGSQLTQAAYAGSNPPARSGSFKRGAGPGHRQGRACPQGSFSFLIHSKITHCKFPDCWERRRKGAEERSCCRRRAGGTRRPEELNCWPGRSCSRAVLASVASPGSVRISTPGKLCAPPPPSPPPPARLSAPCPTLVQLPSPSGTIRLRHLPRRWLASEPWLSTATPPRLAWPREKSCTAKSPRGGTASSAPAPSSMDPPWTCSCPWASPEPARKWPGLQPLRPLPPQTADPRLRSSSSPRACRTGGALPRAHVLRRAGWAHRSPALMSSPWGCRGKTPRGSAGLGACWGCRR